MHVLGIDPGSRITGWAVVCRERGAYRHLASGAIRAPRDGTLAQRVVVIYEALVQVIAEHQPDEVAVEGIFHHRSADSALRLGHARGVVLLAVAQAGLAIHEYAPAQVKNSVSGYGRADKEQVARMVRMLVGEPLPGPSDITDAVAVGITHLAHRDTWAQRAKAEGRRGRSEGGKR